jgi:hypothetical protein
VERFFEKVLKTESCWLWQGTLSNGYGNFAINGGHILAHRYSWELVHGPVPDGLWVLHNCPGGDDPRCCNPAHLWLGTNQDNIADMAKKGSRKGEKSAQAKFTNTDILEMRRLAQAGVSFAEIAVKFSTGRSYVKQIVRRERWSHIP